jgi:hypothetical protein
MHMAAARLLIGVNRGFALFGVQVISGLLLPDQQQPHFSHLPAQKTIENASMTAAEHSAYA